MTYVFSFFDVTKPHILTSKIAAVVPPRPFFVAGYLCHTSTRRRNLLRSRGLASSSAQSAGRRWISCCHPWGLACNVNDEPAKKKGNGAPSRHGKQVMEIGEVGTWKVENLNLLVDPIRNCPRAVLVSCQCYSKCEAKVMNVSSLSLGGRPGEMFNFISKAHFSNDCLCICIIQGTSRSRNA